MYAYLSGRLVVKKPGFVVVDVNGVGYRVEIPLSTYEKLPANGTVTIHTYLKVSDDDLRLYGFATERERDFFLKLIESVSQLGPSKAVAILSSASVDELTQAIEEGDVAFLKAIKGVGEKIANRLVVELKGKLPAAIAGKGEEAPSITKDAVTALLSLGYERREAEERVRGAHKEMPRTATLEDLIRRSLARV